MVCQFVSPGRIVSSGLQEFLELSHSILVNIPTYPHFCRYFDGILWLKPSNFCNRSDLLPSWDSMSYFISMHAVYLCTYTSDILSLLQSVYICICNYNCRSTYMGIVWISLIWSVLEMSCTFQRCCSRFMEVVHISQKLSLFHKPPNNVRVQLQNCKIIGGNWTNYPNIIPFIYTM